VFLVKIMHLFNLRSVYEIHPPEKTKNEVHSHKCGKVYVYACTDEIINVLTGSCLYECCDTFNDYNSINKIRINMYCNSNCSYL